MYKNLSEDPVRKLIEIMRQLRGNEGCPWDQLQTPQTLKPYLLEEAYEVLHSIDNKEPEDIKNELGDLLLQIVFLSTIYEEQKLFNMNDVAQAICEKLIRRHPHVFGDSDEQDLRRLDQQWDSIKKQENSSAHNSIIENMQTNLPALLQAQKMSGRVAKIGFDWNDLAGVMDKLDEEMSELRESVRARNKKEIESEFGDVLFTLVNIGRHLEVDCETSLLKMVGRFKSRFQLMETLISEADEDIEQLDLEQMESFWQEAKSSENAK